MKIRALRLSLICILLSLITIKCFAVNKNYDPLVSLDRFFNHKIILSDRNLDKKVLPKPFDFLLTQPIMTLGLEKYYGHQTEIKKISARINNKVYSRAIIMTLDSPHKPIVEFALIKINLNALPQKVIHDIMNTNIPFGKILAIHHIKSSNQIQEYFSLKCTTVIQEYTHCRLNKKMYGRVNFINSKGKWLAEVIEILPGISKD